MPKELIVHEEWMSNHWYRKNIAVLILNELSNSNLIQPICLFRDVDTDDLPIDEEVLFNWNERDKQKSPIKIGEKCFFMNDKTFCRKFNQELSDKSSGYFVRIKDRFYLKGFFSSSWWMGTGYATIFIDVAKYSSFIENSYECGVMNAVVNSSEVKITSRNQFPWLVSMFKTVNVTLKFAGVGSIISSKHVLTKASRVSHRDKVTNVEVTIDASNLKIHFGSNKFDMEFNLQANVVEKIAIHPKFKADFPRKFNIAVIFLKDTLKFSSVVSPVCLADPTLHVINGGFSVGFKLVSVNRKLRGIKRHVKLEKGGNTTCENFQDELKLEKSTEYFCMQTNDSKSFYQNDQHFYFSEGNKWYLGGFMTMYRHLNNDSIAKKPVILYEDTRKDFKWIEDQMKFRIRS